MVEFMTVLALLIVTSPVVTYLVVKGYLRARHDFAVAYPDSPANGPSVVVVIPSKEEVTDECEASR